MGPKHIYCTSASHGWHPDARNACAKLAYQQHVQQYEEQDHAVAERVAARVIRSERRKAAELVAARDELARVAAAGESEMVLLDLALTQLERRLWKPPRLLHGQELLDARLKAHRLGLRADVETFTRDIYQQVRWRVRKRASDDAGLRALLEENPELEALVREQQKDARWSHVVWDARGVRLDRQFKTEFGQDSGVELHAYVGDHALASPQLNNPADLYLNEELRESIARLTGGMEIEDVMRLEGRSLSRLQDKLATEGLAPTGVQKAERDRLALPFAHSGGHIIRAPLIPGRKTRSQKIAHKEANRNRGNSNRPAKKPKKRWTRDDIAAMREP